MLGRLLQKLSAKPPRLYNDLSAILARKEMTLEADPVCYAQYYPAVMRAIAETGYDLFVAHEFAPKKQDRPADILASLKQAFAACDV